MHAKFYLDPCFLYLGLTAKGCEHKSTAHLPKHEMRCRFRVGDSDRDRIMDRFGRLNRSRGDLNERKRAENA